MCILLTIDSITGLVLETSWNENKYNALTDLNSDTMSVDSDVCSSILLNQYDRQSIESSLQDHTSATNANYTNGGNTSSLSSSRKGGGGDLSR